MGGIKKTPRPTDSDLAKNWFGWANLSQRAADDVRSLHVCVQDELSLIEQCARSKVGADSVDREGETLLAKHLDESIRLLEAAAALLRRLRRLVRS